MINNQSKIFLFGTNCASVVNNLCIGLAANGNPVKAISFDFNRSAYNNFSNITCICTDNNPGQLKVLFYKLKGLCMLVRWLLWCDVVHVYGNVSNLSYWLISKLAKHKFISFVGSDVRVPEIELATNPFFKFAYEDPNYEYKFEKNNRTSSLLHYLHSLHFNFIVWDVDIFIDEDLQPFTAIVPHASTVNQNAVMAVEQKKVPLLVHSPTAPVAKGTPFVLEAIAELKNQKVDFDFVLLKNLPNDAYQQALAKADIYLDQFIWGAYGVAAQQALQMGKVVVNYLTPHRIEQYGPACPIQVANIHNLAAVLKDLIADIEKREKLATLSKEYYQLMHEPSAVARRMLGAYNELAYKK